MGRGGFLRVVYWKAKAAGRLRATRTNGACGNRCGCGASGKQLARGLRNAVGGESGGGRAGLSQSKAARSGRYFPSVPPTGRRGKPELGARSRGISSSTDEKVDGIRIDMSGVHGESQQGQFSRLNGAASWLRRLRKRAVSLHRTG